VEDDRLFGARVAGEQGKDKDCDEDTVCTHADVTLSSAFDRFKQALSDRR
jgi:hypothetical protein